MVLNLFHPKKRPEVEEAVVEQIKKILTQKTEKKVKAVKKRNMENREKGEEMVQQFVGQIVIYNLNYKSQYHQAVV